MARPKRKLTIEHLEQASDAADYFRRMFERESRYLKTSIAKKKGESETSRHWDAREALKKLPSFYGSRDAGSPALIAFQAWADEFVTDVGWTRCLTNLRQARHSKPGLAKMKSIKLPFGTHHNLKRWASKRSLTLDGALVELLRIADGNPSKR